jgi:hypothetical protein
MDTTDIRQSKETINNSTYISAYQAPISTRTRMSIRHDQHVPCLYITPHSEICYIEVDRNLRTFNTLIVR